jgi:hypothetical protein
LSADDTLRFRCYFEELVPAFAVPPGAHGTATRGAAPVPRRVVRPVTLLFFLQDATLAMHDLRVANSGVRWGFEVGLYLHVALSLSLFVGVPLLVLSFRNRHASLFLS